jgi:hypothetical protein
MEDMMRRSKANAAAKKKAAAKKAAGPAKEKPKSKTREMRGYIAPAKPKKK